MDSNAKTHPDTRVAREREAAEAAAARLGMTPEQLSNPSAPLADYIVGSFNASIGHVLRELSYYRDDMKQVNTQLNALQMEQALTNARAHVVTTELKAIAEQALAAAATSAKQADEATKAAQASNRVAADAVAVSALVHGKHISTTRMYGSVGCLLLAGILVFLVLRSYDQVGSPRTELPKIVSTAHAQDRAGIDAGTK